MKIGKEFEIFQLVASSVPQAFENQSVLTTCSIKFLMENINNDLRKWN